MRNFFHIYNHMSPKGIKTQTPKLLRRFGSRLREERVRLGYTQEEFAQIGGVTRRSQILYENGTHSPGVEYLVRVTDAGVFTSRLFQSQVSSTPAASDADMSSEAMDEPKATSIGQVPLPRLLKRTKLLVERYSNVLADPHLRNLLIVGLMEAIEKEMERQQNESPNSSTSDKVVGE